MKKLVILAVVAVVAMFCEATPRRSAKMPVDKSGWRCEGDCDEDAPCKFCNPPPKAKRSAAKKSTAKKQRKRSAKPQKSGARRRSRKSVETPVEASEVAL